LDFCPLTFILWLWEASTMGSLETFCRDAAAGLEETLVLSEEELVVTMQGILNYPVLQQGSVLCQWRKQRKDRPRPPPLQEEHSEAVPRESRHRLEDESSAVEWIRKDLLAKKEQTKASDTEIVTPPSAAAAVVQQQSHSSSTAGRQYEHHHDLRKRHLEPSTVHSKGDILGHLEPSTAQPKGGILEEEVVASSCSDSNKRKCSEDRAPYHVLMLPYSTSCSSSTGTEGRNDSGQVAASCGRGACSDSVWHECVAVRVSFDDIRGKKETYTLGRWV
jgi:hypothetical protein